MMVAGFYTICMTVLFLGFFMARNIGGVQPRLGFWSWTWGQRRGPDVMAWPGDGVMEWGSRL